MNKETSVLIVDDNPDNISVQAGFLRDAGYKVIVATSGEESLNCIDKYSPDAVLLDIMMPGLDGFDTCIEMKKRPNTANLPIIFVSAKDEVDSIDRCFEVGGLDYLSKPIEPRILLARLRTHIITSKKQSIRDKNEAQMSAVIDSLDEGIIAVDNSGEIEFVNQVASEMLGFSRERLLESSITEFMRKQFPIFSDDLLSVIGEGPLVNGMRTIRTVYSKNANEKIDLQINCTKIKDKTEHPTGALYILKKMSIR
jgi:PAS domain S-box-containing protein